MLPLSTLLCVNSIVYDDDLIEGYLKRIFNGALKRGGVDFKIWANNYGQLRDALESGWGKSFTKIKYDTPDGRFIGTLKFHTASFAAFKNHHETGTIADLLIGEDGQPRAWRDFRDQALKISEGYNKVWLQTEYNHAHQSARMARRFKQYEDDADLYPNLEFVAVMDERTREDHAALNGAIYPINDPFWDTYTPPLDWGCRCSIRQTDAEPNAARGFPSVKPAFANNPAKTGKVFDTEGEYYKGVGAKEIDEIDKLTKEFYEKYEDN